MANVYLRSSDGNDGDDGSTWALAKATLASALTAAGAGGTIWASSSHSESSSGNKTIAAGTVDAPIRVLSVDDTSDPEPPTALQAGAVYEATSPWNITYTGYAYFHGFDLKAEEHSWATSDNSFIFDTCTLRTNGSVGSMTLGAAANSVFMILLNTDIDHSGSTSSKFNISNGARLLWDGGALISTPPTTLFDGHIRGFHVTFRNVDLSALSGNLIDASLSDGTYHMTLTRCKLHASLTILTNAIESQGGYDIRLHSCDNGNTTYNFIETYYEGVITTETTIVLTGGASDGTTTVSAKMVANGKAEEFIRPLVLFPISKWTDTTDSTTYTIEFIHDSVTDLQDDEIWMELEYPGADAQGDIVTDKLSSILSSPANQTTSTETWTTTGLTNPNTQKLSVTVTPGKVGPVTARVYLAKPSYTVYVDPKIIES